MKKFLFFFVVSMSIFKIQALQNELKALTRTLQALANQLQPALVMDPSQMDYTLNELARLEKKPYWQESDVESFEQLLGILKVSKASPDLIQQYQVIFDQKKVADVRTLPEPSIPESEPKGDQEPSRVVPEPDEEEGLVFLEPEKMKLALEGLEEISQREKWVKQDFIEFHALLKIINTGGASIDIVEKYTEVFDQKQNRPTLSPPLPRPLKKPLPKPQSG